MKKIWPFSFYFWYFAGIAFMSPFVVLFFQNRGFSGAQIGLLAGLSPLITMVCTPIWTGLADIRRRHGLIMAVSLLGSSLSVFAFPFLTTFLPILVVVVLFSIFLSPAASLADSATMGMLADERDLYGRLRLGGTIGFAIAAPIAGWLVQEYGLKIAFWGSALMFLLAFGISQKFVHPTWELHEEDKTSFSSGIRVMITNPRLLLFFAGALVGGFTVAMSNNYFFPYMKELGADTSSMGLALALGTVGEMPVLFFGNRLLQFFKAYPLFILSLVITGVRLLLFSFAGNPSQAMLIQIFSGMAFPAMWMAGVSYVDENAPAGLSASAQGIFGAIVFGVGSALGGFTGGALLESIGARGMCLVFGIVTLLIMALVMLAGRLLPRGIIATNRGQA